jgi:UDP-GlcNAc:undecaprenyl-phosphate GlcNAc-1-phosphate transferase
MRKIAQTFRIFDKPNEHHKTHRIAIPYLGGLAIIISVVSVSSVGTIIGFNKEPAYLNLAVYIILPALVLSIVGLVDDIKKLTPRSRFVVQTIAGLFTATALVFTNTAGTPLGIFWLDYLISILWIVGIANSINFLDNHDGGAAGIVAVSSFFLFLLAEAGSQFLIAALALALCGSCLGFLIWNKHPASIYMGDAGALFLGTLLAGLLVRFNPESGNRFASFLMPIFLVAIPILDTSIAVISRMARKKSPFEGGRDHLSHRLMRKGFSASNTPRILWSLSGIFGIGTLILANLPEIFQSFFSLVLMILWLSLFRYFWKVSHE